MGSISEKVMYTVINTNPKESRKGSVIINELDEPGNIVEIDPNDLVNDAGESIGAEEYLAASAMQSSGLYFDGGSTSIFPELGLSPEQGEVYMAGLVAVSEIICDEVRAETAPPPAVPAASARNDQLLTDLVNEWEELVCGTATEVAALGYRTYGLPGGSEVSWFEVTRRVLGESAADGDFRRLIVEQGPAATIEWKLLHPKWDHLFSDIDRHLAEGRLKSAGVDPSALPESD
jgi:hypothetical protein